MGYVDGYSIHGEWKIDKLSLQITPGHWNECTYPTKHLSTYECWIGISMPLTHVVHTEEQPVHEFHTICYYQSKIQLWHVSGKYSL